MVWKMVELQVAVMALRLAVEKVVMKADSMAVMMAVTMETSKSVLWSEQWMILTEK